MAYLRLSVTARLRNIDCSVEQLRLADYLGARCTVNVAGSMGARWDGGYKANFSSEAWQGSVDMTRTVIDRANVKNTFFSIEPMPRMIPSSP